jgi:hypothetical protein
VGDRVTIHANPGLRHQVEAARVLKAGFDRHGLQVTVTESRTEDADIHVCMGPWYALQQNLGRRVFYLDRAFWGDPNSVSLQWLDTLGNKLYRWGREERRQHPALREYKYGGRAVVLCDYGMDGARERREALRYFDAVEVRRHPSDRPEAETLDECLAAHQVAIGRHTTALVQAAIAGLAVYSDTPYSPVAPIARLAVGDKVRRPHRTQWINDLAWHNWALAEIESGDAWHYLNQ